MSVFQSILPSLSGRGTAKRAQMYEDIRHSNAVIQQRNRNETARLQQANATIANNRHNQRVSRQFFKDLETYRSNSAAMENQLQNERLERYIGKEAAAGMVLAQTADRGLGGTGLAERINAQQAFRISQIEGQAIDAEKAAKYNQVGSVEGFVNSAFSNIATDVPMAALDFSNDQRQTFKRQSFGKALLKDAGRAVASFYGGTLATKVIDAVEGSERSYQRQMAGIQNALDAQYGAGVVQNRTANRPNWMSLVSGLKGGNLLGSAAGVFTGQKDGNNSGWSAEQFGQAFNGLSNLFANRPSTNTGPGRLGSGYSGFSINGYTGGTTQVGNSGGFDFGSLFKLFGGK